MNEVISSERTPPSDPGTFSTVNIYKPNSLDFTEIITRVLPGSISQGQPKQFTFFSQLLQEGIILNN